MNYGIQKEIEIVTAINKRKYSELNDNLKLFINFIFGKISDNDIILASKIKGVNKADISIEINGVIKNISVKNGSENSIHSEKLDTFVTFLRNLKIKENIIDYLKLYHYGDGTKDGSGIKRLGVDEVKIIYSNKIFAFNKYVSYNNLLTKIIDRFLFEGTSNNKAIADAIYYGNSSYGIWASKKEIIDYLIKSKSLYMKSIHFSNLTYQNLCRNVCGIEKSESRRNCIQIKWFSIVADLQKIRSEFDSN